MQERWGQYRADHAQLKPLQAKLERARAERAKAAKRKLQDMEQYVIAAVANRERWVLVISGMHAVVVCGLMHKWDTV